MLMTNLEPTVVEQSFDHGEPAFKADLVHVDGHPSVMALTATLGRQDDPDKSQDVKKE